MSLNKANSEAMEQQPAAAAEIVEEQPQQPLKAVPKTVSKAVPLALVEKRKSRMQRAKSCVVKKANGNSGGGGGSGGSGGGGGFHDAVLSVTRSNSLHNMLHGKQRNNSSNASYSNNNVEAAAAAESSNSNNKSGQSSRQGSSGPSTKPRFKMKERTKLLLKLHIIHEKAVGIDEMLRQLQILTLECQDCPLNEECDLDDAHEAFIQKILDIDGQVKLLIKLVLFLCRHRFLERHESFLSSIQNQMKPTLDISVQFFGIDWNHLFRISQNLVQLIDDLINAVKEDHRELGGEHNNLEVDLVLPSNILRNLATIESDVTYHADAVLKGRLSKRHREAVELAQKRYEEKLLELQLEEAEAKRGGGGGKGKRGTMKRMRQRSAAAAAARKRGDPNLELLEESKGKRSLWNTVKAMQYSIFRKSNPPPQTNDDLWRLWYLGLQSVTLSVSILATPTNQTSTPPPATLSPLSSPLTTEEEEEEQNNNNSSTLSPANLLPHVTIDTPPPSQTDQIHILGVYSKHRVTPRMNESRLTLDRMMMVKDDTMESLKILDMVDAPRQDVQESEL